MIVLEVTVDTIDDTVDKIVDYALVGKKCTVNILISFLISYIFAR
jgi:hypothetical protein